MCRPTHFVEWSSLNADSLQAAACKIARLEAQQEEARAQLTSLRNQLSSITHSGGTPTSSIPQHSSPPGVAEKLSAETAELGASLKRGYISPALEAV